MAINRTTVVFTFRVAQTSLLCPNSASYVRLLIRYHRPSIGSSSAVRDLYNFKAKERQKASGADNRGKKSGSGKFSGTGHVPTFAMRWESCRRQRKND
jgi:hypothetical protein